MKCPNSSFSFETFTKTLCCVNSLVYGTCLFVLQGYVWWDSLGSCQTGEILLFTSAPWSWLRVPKHNTLLNSVTQQLYEHGVLGALHSRKLLTAESRHSQTSEKVSRKRRKDQNKYCRICYTESHWTVDWNQDRRRNCLQKQNWQVRVLVLSNSVLLIIIFFSVLKTNLFTFTYY